MFFSRICIQNHYICPTENISKRKQFCHYQLKSGIPVSKTGSIFRNVELIPSNNAAAVVHLWLRACRLVGNNNGRTVHEAGGRTDCTVDYVL